MTSIEWTRGDDGTAGSTWNPAVSGCSMISPGCTNCYAMKQAHRFSGPSGHARYRGLTVLGKHGPRWTGEVRVTNDALDAPLHWKKPRRIFVNSMTDLFHEDVPNETIAAVFGVMAACPQHTFQVLTKRAERLPRWFAWLESCVSDRLAAVADGPLGTKTLTPADHVVQMALRREEVRAALPRDQNRAIRMSWPTTWPLPNVHLGVSVESPDYLWRVDELLKAPAAVRFISAEPLLADLGDLKSRIDYCEHCDKHGIIRNPNGTHAKCDRPCGISWVIAGGESGPGARPCAVEWIESIVSQCRAAQVPVFVKQLGKVVHWNGIQGGDRGCWPRETATEDTGLGVFRKHLVDQKGGDMDEWPEDLRVREFPR